MITGATADEAALAPFHALKQITVETVIVD
ncbi:hypothetical protein PMI33_03479 [Pseudomonas sp. GM67]|nr:hypothetical protein PMI33_03479 [Pseudomonas sp. GM67]